MERHGAPSLYFFKKYYFFKIIFEALRKAYPLLLERK